MSYAYMNDRQAVELMIPALMVATLARDVEAWDQDDPDATAMVCQVRDHLLEDLHAHWHHDKAKAGKRVARAQRDATSAMRVALGESFGVTILAVHRFLARLIRKGTLELHEGSPFDRAWTRFCEAVEDSPEAYALDSPDARGRADVVARAMLQELQDRNYYQGA